MVVHFGFMENYGDYESPMYGCEEVVCGTQGEFVTENATDDWDMVTCKKCLKLKDEVIRAEHRDNEEAARQLGEMADFMAGKK